VAAKRAKIDPQLGLRSSAFGKEAADSLRRVRPGMVLKIILDRLASSLSDWLKVHRIS
jgi:hypothetical protein